MFAVGNRVSIDGDLYAGTGVVEWFSMQFDGSRHVKRDQPFPQVSVRCGDGKLRHYNGSDLANGKVLIDNTPAAAPQAPAATRDLSPEQTAPGAAVGQNILTFVIRVEIPGLTD